MDDVGGRLSGRGQVTVPKDVRDALGVAKGDEVFFRVEGRRAIVAGSTEALDPEPALTMATVLAFPSNRGEHGAVMERRRLRRRATLRMGYRTG